MTKQDGGSFFSKLADELGALRLELPAVTPKWQGRAAAAHASNGRTAPGGWYETADGVLARLLFETEAVKDPDEKKFWHERGMAAAFHFSPNTGPNADRSYVNLGRVRQEWSPITPEEARHRLAEWGIDPACVTRTETRIQG